MPDAASEIRQFSAGDVLVLAGDVPNALYVVRRGQIVLDGGKQHPEFTLGPGMPVLLPDLLDRRSSRWTARAATSASVMRVDAKTARALAASSVAMRHKVDVLRCVVWKSSRSQLVIDDAGTAIRAEYSGSASEVQVLYRLTTRRVVACSGRDPLKSFDRTTYDDIGRGIHRALYRAGGCMVGLEVEGPWHELHQGLQALGDRRALTDAELMGFERHGCLFDPPDEVEICPDAIICHCRGLTRRDLENAMRTGAVGADALIEATGATTTCGGCIGPVVALAGVSGSGMILDEVRAETHDVRVFRFRSEGTLAPCKAGQHVVVSMEDDEGWVHRPYTLTSPAGETRWREIAVKRDPYGRMGRALSALQVGAVVRLSNPRGEFWVEVGGEEPVVCLAGGIGVTPVVAIARTFAAEGAHRSLHIELFNTLGVDVAFREELQAIAAKTPTITLNCHTTFETGLPQRSLLKALNTRLPGARFYVCGPPGFTRAMSGHLTAVGAGARTQVEHFAAKATMSDRAVPASASRTVMRWLTGTLLVAYAIQARIDIPFPWLDGLRDAGSWRLWSGLGLVAYIVFQMSLGGSRLGGHRKTSAWLYHAHRIAGVGTALLLYLHTRNYGVGYQLVLSGMFLANAGVGMLDKTLAAPACRERWASWWLPLHISLSMGVIGALMFHTYIVLAYR